MKRTILMAMILLSTVSFACDDSEFLESTDFDIQSATIRHMSDLGILVAEINVSGTAGGTTPSPAGQLHGAPVLGYVFPTTLSSEDVGFGTTAGIVALALTSHPDFDDTPLWDEDWDGEYANDGIQWHAHWVILTEDNRVDGGLAVRQFDAEDGSVVLPPTNPGMPMYMDSPGFAVTTRGHSIRVVVPVYRVGGKTDFNFDGVAAYMEVNTEDESRPMLGVYEVYSVASGDLSLPYSIIQE